MLDSSADILVDVSISELDNILSPKVTNVTHVNVKGQPAVIEIKVNVEDLYN